jgi:Zn-finger nucleic acid-binding protein
MDSSELNKMAFQVKGNIENCSKNNAEIKTEKKKNCPRCEKIELDEVIFVGYSDIILDRCDNCGGFWLDGGELDLVNKFLEDIMPVKGKGFSEFVNNVHLPYWFKKVKRKSSETDFYNEVKPIINAELVNETELICPSCNSKLNLYKIFGIKFEGCPECQGLFLDKNELRLLKDKTERSSWANLRWMDDEVESIDNTTFIPSKIKCPKCPDKRMISTIFGSSKIILDYCIDCHGLWLDRGEYQGIITQLSENLTELMSEEMKQKVKEEIKEIWSGPENKISEILDAFAAMKALGNIKIYEHPRLAKLLTDLPRIL